MSAIIKVKFTLNESNFYHTPAPNLNYSTIQTPTPNPNSSPNTEPLNTVDFFSAWRNFWLPPAHRANGVP